MRDGVRGLALLLVLGASLWIPSIHTVRADEPPPAYDISWPQCPGTFPEGEFSFAVIGLNNGRPFSTNDCFRPQYRWAQKMQSHPDVYINLDFPRPGNPRAATGPLGKCQDDDDWCRGYNYGHALAKDNIRRATSLGVSPARYWFDVEMINHWSESTENNSQVVRGALDYFLDLNIPVGIYATRYQWGLITGGYMPTATLPIWVAGARDRAAAARRCGDTSYMFAGGETWMVQYPEGAFDGNVLCPRASAVGDEPATTADGRAPAPTPPSGPEQIANPIFPFSLGPQPIRLTEIDWLWWNQPTGEARPTREP